VRRRAQIVALPIVAAIVLAIGVAASLFSSIFVTHNLLAIVLSWTAARRPGLLGVDRDRAG